MGFGKAIQQNRDLRHRKEAGEHLQGSALRAVFRVPHGHVAMGRGGSAQQTDVQRSNSVAQGVPRAVTRPEHVAEAAHQRADVLLAELDHDVRPQGVQPVEEVGQQPVGRLGQAGAVGPRAGRRRRRTAERELVHKVELEAVEPPLAEGPLVGADDVGPHLGVARVEDPGPQRLQAVHQPAGVAFHGLARVPHEGQRVPEQEGHAQAVHLLDQGGHVSDPLRLPIPRVGIAAAAVAGLPAVIHDDSGTTQLASQPALGEHRGRLNLLVQAVPGAVHWPAGRVRHGPGLMLGDPFPPPRHLGQRLLPRKVAGVDANAGLAADGRLLLPAE